MSDGLRIADNIYLSLPDTSLERGDGMGRRKALPLRVDPSAGPGDGMGCRKALPLRVDPSTERRDYPTWPIQKGLILSCSNCELVEEGTGFGLPLVRSGRVTLFPGDARVIETSRSDGPSVTVRYALNLVETTTVGHRTVAPRVLQGVREYFSALHRKYPSFRPLLTRASHRIRQALKLNTRFERLSPAIEVTVDHLFAEEQGLVRVRVNTAGLSGCTEIILANEQGASHFDRYRDSDGLDLEGDAIGTWDETFAAEASLLDERHNLSFAVRRVPGARLFRGRELEPGRLAWAGLNYVVRPPATGFAYDIRIAPAQIPAGGSPMARTVGSRWGGSRAARTVSHGHQWDKAP